MPSAAMHGVNCFAPGRRAHDAPPVCIPLDPHPTSGVWGPQTQLLGWGGGYPLLNKERVSPSPAVPVSLEADRGIPYVSAYLGVHSPHALLVIMACHILYGRPYCNDAKEGVGGITPPKLNRGG